MAKGNIGRIVQVTGAVVDDGVSPRHSPKFITQSRSTATAAIVIAEVQQQLGNDRVRCVVMDTTDGHSTRMEGKDTGAADFRPRGP